ncbi:MAG: hypothetical protein NZM43_09045 [Saprospiraceae bacterium]|nr:hypothetical protein [Saprospiraceae bacterium]MDW8484459.1 hypothetical protein [Saprospiraceae bacterium]
MRISIFWSWIILLTYGLACTPYRQASRPMPSSPRPMPSRPADRSTKPNHPMDTIRWKPAPNAPPPITDGPGDRPTMPSSTTYRLALLLPFQTDQVSAQDAAVPTRSLPALQFYAGATLAFQRLSESGLNLEVEVLDIRSNDSAFYQLLNHPRLQKAHVIIGPMRASQVSVLAERSRQTRQIVVSPESPTMGLARQNPDFIQINPSLRAHGAAIVQHILARHRPENVCIVARRREAERIPLFQPTQGARFTEILTPDEGHFFDKIDFEPCFRPGQPAVFILPTWGNQDFVMAFFRKINASRKGRPVIVYGLPQWRQFENIELEYFADLNVHLSSATYFDFADPAVRAFQQAFFDAYGTAPDEEAFNGYDVVLLVGKGLQQFGLNFPQRLSTEPPFKGLRTTYRFSRVPTAEPVSNERALAPYDYLENTYVHILRFQNYRFEPAW